MGLAFAVPSSFSANREGISGRKALLSSGPPFTPQAQEWSEAKERPRLTTSATQAF